MRTLTALIALAAAALFLAALTSPVYAAGNEYVGVKTCSKCHKKEKDGEQYKIWQKTDHAKAYETLGTAKAKKAAATVGVSGNPQKSEACLICHTTGFGEPESMFGRHFKMEDGVQCEACHGPGSEYKSKKTMKKIHEERGKNKGKSATAEKVGLIIPDENTCKVCHQPERKVGGKTYKNPSYKDFNFKKYWDKIKHPIP